MSLLTLIGAGPGDPELITIKAVRALEGADVILYDALANQHLLRYASPSSLKVFAGKRFGCHYLSQQEINDLIVAYGQTYPHVVRLKGGDPFVFGRATEEIEAARSAGMDVQTIPGISSCIAAPAAAHIPLTSRGINESFWVTTGTTRDGTISPDLYLAARSSATVVILMAMSRIEQIMDIFLTAGKADTPVAVIQEATTENQKIAIGTVNDICFRAQHLGLGNPAVILVGEVVNLHNNFSKISSEIYSAVVDQHK